MARRKRNERQHCLATNRVRWALPTPDSELRELRTAELLALAEFTSGTAGPTAWRDLDDVRRVAAALGRAGIGEEALPLADAVAESLTRSWREGEAMQLDAEGLRLVRELIGLHDLQRRAASLAEFVRANEQAACRPG